MSQISRTNRIVPFERTPIADLELGQHLEGYLAAVRGTSIRDFGEGKTLFEIKVADSSGCRTAKLWIKSEDTVAEISASSFLEIWGDVDSSEKYAGDIRISRYRCATVPLDISEFIEQPRSSSKEYQRRLVEILKQVRDPELRPVLKHFFGKDSDFGKRFKSAHAASSIHHAFAGGLLEHTVEVAELALKCCDVIKGLDRDLLVSGALLHDIGKLEEMDHELRAGELTDDGYLIGHLVLGSVRVAQVIDEINREAEPNVAIHLKTKRALMHLILSHHGIPEHGAARRPAAAEAYLLYLCDNMSAKARQFMDLCSANQTNATGTFSRTLEGPVYLRQLRDWQSEICVETEIGEDEFIDVDARPANTSFVTAISLPVLGRVAAGSPDEINQTQDSEFRKVIPPPAGADFLVYVVGDSMIGAGINEGDLLFVKRDENPSDGEIVVAHIPGEGQTVKYLRKNTANGSSIDVPHLEAANPKYRPIPLGGTAIIQGKVTGLVRDL